MTSIKDANEKSRVKGQASTEHKTGEEEHFRRSAHYPDRFSRRSSLRRTLQKAKSVEQRDQSAESEDSRGSWGSKWEFLLSCVGLSVGIGNVWRFPYLAYENGGGAFLIPYLIMLTLAGKPMYFMELSFGQFGGMGALSIWSCAPIAKGIGAAMVACCLIVCIYYNVIMSYSLYFIGSSFQYKLPWTRCDPSWSKDTNCMVRTPDQNFTVHAKSASQIYWERKVLEATDTIEDLGGIKWDLALCLFISWTIVILCLLKGVKTSGKVVYFAATFPYIILFSLLIAGLTLNGAWEGVRYFVTPTWNKLLSIKVWLAAASQMFFSLSVSMGALIMYSSYNDFRHDIFKDAMVVSILDTLTSIISGLVIFSVLGAMAKDLEVAVEDVVKGGPGLAFVAYPEALSRLPLAHLWSVLFFLMLFTLGLDSEFALLENVITSIADESNFVQQKRLIFTVAIGVLCFLIGLPCVTRGGQYIIEIMDQYGAGLPLVYIAVAECIAVMWIYGYKNFSFDILYMLNRPLGPYWKFTWIWTSPLVLAFIAFYSLINREPLKLGNYEFPWWVSILGSAITGLILIQIPVWACYAILKQRKADTLLEKIKRACRSTEDWGPKDDDTRKDWKIKRKQLNQTLDKAKVDSSEGKEPAVLKAFSMAPENDGIKSDNNV